jgi:hypothetical protein
LLVLPLDDVFHRQLPGILECQLSEEPILDESGPLKQGLQMPDALNRLSLFEKELEKVGAHHLPVPQMHLELAQRYVDFDSEKVAHVTA